MNGYLNNLINDVNALPECRCYGSVCAVKGMLVEISGIRAELSVGDRCRICARGGKKVVCEVVGFNNDKVLAMPFMNLDGVGPGNQVDLSNAMPVLFPDVSWLGRVINAMGEPVDGKGPLIKGKKPCLIHNSPPPAHSRERVAGKADLGVRAINTFLTVCKGQRMGIFAGSGVGKSSLMAMMARHTQLDVTVLGLIGERGREAREFIEDDLGTEGMKRSVVVVATSDESPLMRRQAAYVAMTVAEYFRDLKQNVLCMMDSITRFAMAQREISLPENPPRPKVIRQAFLPNCRGCWNVRDRGRSDWDQLRDCLRYWLTETTITNRLPMPYAVFWTDISFWKDPSPNAIAIRPSIFCAVFHVRCRGATMTKKMLWSTGRAL